MDATCRVRCPNYPPNIRKSFDLLFEHPYTYGMREWNLGPGDPMSLTLAADFRFCTPDYVNDQIWELELGGGDPQALSIRTTYGLRARSMRIFPRFTLKARTVTDPAEFATPPRLRHFHPNFLGLAFQPFPGLDVLAEFRVPDSHTLAGRLTVTNHGGEALVLLLELCGQLIPMDEEGQAMAPLAMQSVNVLSGGSRGLYPVIFFTGGPRPGPGPFPSLALELALDPGAARTLTWAQAALATPEGSFDMARKVTAIPWEAERSHIEMVNEAQTCEIHTGNPDWDAAFAFSQKTAFGLFFNANQHLPAPSFVLSRQPDQGYSPRGDGSDQSHLWSGQPVLEAWYLANILPGAPELAAGLLRNFFSTRGENGALDCKPGLAGQRGRWLAAPLLADMAWRVYQHTGDKSFLREVHPILRDFIKCWLDGSHDQDGDGFPEWEHALQTGLEDSPAFSVWSADGQGAAISFSESPALASLLYREVTNLARIETEIALGEGERSDLNPARLGELVEECWDADAGFYHLRDRDTHASPAGKLLGGRSGPGTIRLDRTFQTPVRLLVRIEYRNETTRKVEMTLQGQKDGQPQVETLKRMDLQWGAGLAVATSRSVYTGIEAVNVTGLDKRDRVTVSVMDFSGEDISLLLPLWAHIPDLPRVLSMLERDLLAPGRFGRRFGIPTCPASSTQMFSLADESVHLPWNALVGEGLLGYGLQAEAAHLTGQLMAAVIQNLKQQHAFAHAYHAGTGAGRGEHNPLEGLAPRGLFLGALGVQIRSPHSVILTGKNPFPWPVTVKYRGLTVTRQADQTLVVFPDGSTTRLDDPTNVMVSAE